MRFTFPVILALALTITAPAFAGTVTMANGQVTWQSTQCAVPTEPPALASINPETPADKVNECAIQYNQYAQQMQAYMDCMSNEAQVDATQAAKSVVASAQLAIEETQKRVAALGASMQRH